MTTEEDKKAHIALLYKQENVYSMRGTNFMKMTELVYGKTIEITDVSNDSTIRCFVGESEYDDGDILANAKEYGSIDAWAIKYILCDMCRLGYIPYGNYNISVS